MIKFGEKKANATYQVGLMGASLHTPNRGVSALGAALATLIWQSRPDAAISMLIGNRDAKPGEVSLKAGVRVVETVNYRLSPRAPFNQQLWWIVLMSGLYRLVPVAATRRWIIGSSTWIRWAAESDFIGDIRGGDSFSDIYGAKNFMAGCLPVLSVIWIRGGIHLLPQTYGPFRSRLAERLARYILLRAHSIWCRDRMSLQEISRLTGGQRRGALCADVAFALEAIRPASLVVDAPFRHQEGETLIGLNVSGLVYYGGYTRANMFDLTLDYQRFVKCLVEQLLVDTSNRILLVPHTFGADGSVESDPAACRELKQQLPPSLRDRLHLVTQQYNQHEIKGVIGICDFFIGSRMHACIAALSQGIPTIGVAYSRKFAGVFEAVGAADWVIDGRTHCVEDSLHRVGELFSQRHAQTPILRTRVDAAKEQLSRSFDRVLGVTAASKTTPEEPAGAFDEVAS